MKHALLNTIVALLVCRLAINGLVMTTWPKDIRFLPGWLRTAGLVNTTAGDAEAVLSRPLWHNRCKGLIHLLLAVLFAWATWRLYR
jgi:hypothetical protein